MSIFEKKKFGGLVKLSHAQLIDELIKSGSTDLGDTGNPQEISEASDPETSLDSGIGLAPVAAAGIIIGGLHSGSAFGGDGSY